MKTINVILIFLFFTINTFSQTIISKKSVEIKPILEKYHSEKFVIIDGRDSTKFSNGHIRNSINIDAFSENSDKNLSKYLKHDTIVIYCTLSNRVETLLLKLKELNYTGLIYNINDGFTGWQENKFEISTSVFYLK
jgi:rhodanese-related sulfurtransferase